VTPSASANLITWSTDNPGVATVSGAGLVEAKSIGAATISVKKPGGTVMATCIVTVVTDNPSDVTGVTLDKSLLAIKVGESYQLKAAVTPQASAGLITWTSSNPDAATVTDGLVTAKSKGITAISVKKPDGTVMATCAVTVVAADAPNSPSEEKPDINIPPSPVDPVNPSQSTTALINLRFIANGQSYTLSILPDGTYSGIAPSGVDISKLALYFSLPAGATCYPASGSEQDFSKGPVTYTVTKANGEMEQHVVSIRNGDVGDATAGQLVNPDGSDWSIDVTKRSNNTYRLTITMPLTSNAIPTHLSLTTDGINLDDIKITDGSGGSYPYSSYARLASAASYALQISGVTDDPSLELFSIQNIVFYLNNDLNRYQQNFRPAIGFKDAGAKTGDINSSKSGENSGGGGCVTGGFVFALPLLLAAVKKSKHS
jgi:hypothetical protein